jgi:hypothetical protein
MPLGTPLIRWNDLNLSNLAPTQSSAEWSYQYQTQLALASSPTAEPQSVTDFLSYATKYLEFQRTFGTEGMYQSIYNAVVADVTGIQATTMGRHGSGGYSDRPAIFGERGGEWAVPTYEPQRKNFLKSAPKSFWDNLGLNGGSNGPGGEVTVHSHIYLDGKEIQTCVSKGFKTNSDLIQSARRAVN